MTGAGEYLLESALTHAQEPRSHRDRIGGTQDRQGLCIAGLCITLNWMVGEGGR